MDFENESAETEPRQENQKSRVLTLWLVLLFSVGMIMYYQAQPLESPPETQQEVLPEVAFQMTFLGKYTLGVGSFIQVGGKEAIDKGSTEEEQVFDLLMMNIKKMATHPVDELRASALVAEMMGPERAQTYLNELAENPNFPANAVGDLEIFRTLYSDGPDSLTENQREDLTARHGWFGELALCFGKPDEDPFRKEVLSAAKSTFLGLFLAGIGAFGVAGLGFLLMLIAVIRGFTGNPPKLRYRAPNTPAGVHLAFLETMVLFLAGFLALSLLPQLFGFSLGPFTLPVLAVFALWPRARGLSWQAIQDGLGWHRGEGILKEMVLGLVGYITCIPLLLIGFLLTVLLSSLGDQQPVHPIVYEFKGAGVSKLLILFGLACIVAPILEETLFRGVFYHYLRRRFTMVAAAAISGLIFAAIHPQGVLAIPALGMIGFVFAVLREWRGSIIAPMTAHFANNFTVLSFAVFLFR